jgi:hypothetical protein
LPITSAPAPEPHSPVGTVSPCRSGAAGEDPTLLESRVVPRDHLVMRRGRVPRLGDFYSLDFLRADLPPETAGPRLAID